MYGMGWLNLFLLPYLIKTFVPFSFVVLIWGLVAWLIAKYKWADARQGFLVAEQSVHYVLKGSYVRLDKGVYKAFFRLNLLSNSDSPIAELEVTTLDGRQMHGYRIVHGKHFANTGTPQVFSVPFVCYEDDLTFEFRVKSCGAARFAVGQVPQCKRDIPRGIFYAARDWKRRITAKWERSALSGGTRDVSENGLVERSFGTQTQRFYGEQYYRSVNPRTEGGYSNIKQLIQNERVLAEIVLEHYSPQRILDVGCSLGGSVQMFRQQGIEAFGIDYSEYAIAHAPRNVRPWIKVGNVLSIDYPDRSFDLVVCSEVLEHLPTKDIDRALKELKRVSRGMLILSMPSIGVNEFGPPHGLAFPSIGQVDIVPPHLLDLDREGRPWGGHLTIASFRWWAERLAEHRLSRSGKLERQMNKAQLERGLHIWNFYCCDIERE
jgi:SAM-dependent methyltransferase